MGRKEQRIHISEIDEFLAGCLGDHRVRPFKLGLRKNGEQGYLKAFVEQNGDLVEDEGIDFELSPSEIGELEDSGIRDFITKPVYTSSAYELFDYILRYFDSFECLVDFKENAWLVKVVKTN